MSLSALNRPKDAFWITAIASVANILLDLAFIPIMGITGAAVATLIAMTLNASGALILLSRVIPLKVEYGAVKNIIFASGFMSIFLLVMHFFLPITHVIAVFTLVLAGAVIYMLVVLKLDQNIHEEIKALCQNLGVPWPGWL
jgi:O-antigen/teichoic acid export membrane protein